MSTWQLSVQQNGDKKSAVISAKNTSLATEEVVNITAFGAVSDENVSKMATFPLPCTGYSYSDVIMGAMASQITRLTIVYSTVYSGASKKTIKRRVTALCAGNSPVTGEFPAQMASNAKNVSIRWRYHVADIDECVSSPCGVGTCEDRLNGYICQCPTGFAGTNCQIGKPCPLGWLTYHWKLDCFFNSFGVIKNNKCLYNRWFGKGFHQ